MVVDYSKWDKLELSDDSDIEVHPNVDKQSFIRWKQRDIHEKREHLKARMQQLELNSEVNHDLKDWVEFVIELSESGKIKLNGSFDAIGHALNGKFVKKGPSKAPQDSDQPQYIDMMVSLFGKINEEVEEMNVEQSQREEALLGRLKFHLGKLEEAIEVENKEYEELVEERSHHILSEDIHTGFDSTFVNKESAVSGSSSKKTEKETAVEVLNPGAASRQTQQQQQPQLQTHPSDQEDDPDDVKASADAIEFSKIKAGDYETAYRFLSTHPQLASEKEKDGLMMEAFQLQLSGKTDEMKRTVHNALLLQYCAALGPDGIRLFFSRARQSNHPATEALRKDVDFTSNHIISRCEVIKSEQTNEAEQEGVEQIQLHAVDPNTEILVSVPDEHSPGYEVYNQFSPEMKQAIATKKLEEINKVLEHLSVEEAEDLVQKFDQCGVLSVEQKIYDAKEWQQHKKELSTEEASIEATLDPQSDPSTVPSTVDDVD